MTASPPFERIVFDCDSTLSSIEGIEELSANNPELRKSVEALTADAMAGKIPLESVYGQRLSLINPKQIDVMRIGSRYVETAVPGAKELIAGLHSLDKEVLIISGGLRLPVVTFAAWLGVPDHKVHAVQVRFQADNRYHDYDRRSPLARNGGKCEVLRSLPEARTVFIGDGITDAETREVVDSFICFGGVVLRDDVAARADALVETLQMAALLPLLCSADELDRLSRDPRHSHLMTLARGL
ncbi:MAG: phosphoserine phosphatase [Pseudohongiellaceae bacterium]|jgi:phosphoserine phosphatase